MLVCKLNQTVQCLASIFFVETIQFRDETNVDREEAHTDIAYPKYFHHIVGRKLNFP